MPRPQPEPDYSFDAYGDFSGSRANLPPQRLPNSPPPGYDYEPPQPPLHRQHLPSENQQHLPSENRHLPWENRRHLPTQQQHLPSQNPFDDRHAAAYAPHRPYEQSSHDPHALRPGTDTTAGVDNLGPAAAGGGISGIAMGVAHHNERESGLQAARGMPPGSSGGHYGGPNDHYDPIGSDTPYVPEHPHRPHGPPTVGSTSSSMPLTAAAGGSSTRDLHSGPPSSHDVPLGDYPSPGGYDHGNGYNHAMYSDSPYKRFSSPWDPRVDQNVFNPDDIADDGDDGMGHRRGNKRRSLIGLGRQPSGNVAGAAAGGAAAGGAMGALGGMVGSRNGSGNYGPVGAADGAAGSPAEKSAWLAKEAAARRKKRLILIVIAVIVVIAIIAGATAAGILVSRRGSSSSGSRGNSAADDDGNGDLDADSSEIKKLLNNPDLHRVFPGIDYTPYNAQYPDCLSNPPSQNNVTRDMAVLSQLTKTVKLYGTDCNQTDMVLHAIKQLGLTDMKVWPAVWLDKNATTNARGLKDLNSILKRFGGDPFEGVVVGNEVLYREDLTKAELLDVVQTVKSNLTKLGLDLPIAVADLGDNWKADMVEDVDVIMSNIHPFFAGTEADKAAGWTWDFWQGHDVVLTAGNATKRNIISEVGWPSDGGNKCGEVKCTSDKQGSIAGIDEMNLFMEDFVCQSLKNKTEFFWFEAFDEPWKVRFNKDDEQWEDKWGLMYIDRTLKPGVKVPDCGGQTV